VQSPIITADVGSSKMSRTNLGGAERFHCPVSGVSRIRKSVKVLTDLLLLHFVNDVYRDENRERKMTLNYRQRVTYAPAAS
jgi:hypothetical protein